MKSFKRIAIVAAGMLLIGITSVTALASGYSNPAEIVAGLTGQSVDSVIAEKNESGETYGAIADKAGVLDQFQSQMQEQKKAVLAERVAAGSMTQERADDIIAKMETNQANCDGSCSGGAGMGMGAGFGNAAGNHRGNGQNGSGSGLGICTRQAD